MCVFVGGGGRDFLPQKKVVHVFVLPFFLTKNKKQINKHIFTFGGCASQVVSLWRAWLVLGCSVRVLLAAGHRPDPRGLSFGRSRRGRGLKRGGFPNVGVDARKEKMGLWWWNLDPHIHFFSFLFRAPGLLKKMQFATI